jgi:hypothetical protein
MAITYLEILLIFVSKTLPIFASILCFTWLFFTCFKIDSDNKLKGNYFIWKNLSYIKDDPELKQRIIEHMEKTEAAMNINEAENESKA